MFKKFEIIKDTRFSDNPLQWVEQTSNKMQQALKNLGIDFQVFPLRKIEFPEIEPCTSYRQKIRMMKKKGVTWQTIQIELNKIHAVCLDSD